MARFQHELAQETESEQIVPLLQMDYERIAGPTLRRLLELQPDDCDLQIELAYWNYHFGYDEEAWSYWQMAKAARPSDSTILKTEIYFNYGAPSEEVASLVQQALEYCPEDKWLQAVARSIEDGSYPGEMKGPEIRSKWRRLLFGT